MRSLVRYHDAEADIVAFIEQRTGTNYHPTSTCAIGRVVDSNLRVFGTEGLRIADASVMPSIVRGNTNAAVIANGESRGHFARERTRQGAVITFLSSPRRHNGEATTSCSAPL